MPEHEIKLIIVYGTNKPLEVKPVESIEAVKLGAMGLFDVPASEQNSYVLLATVDGKEVAARRGQDSGGVPPPQRSEGDPRRRNAVRRRMTETVTTPEDEAKVAVAGEYAMVAAQQHEYGWRSTVIDAGDYLVIFVKIEKPGDGPSSCAYGATTIPRSRPSCASWHPRCSTIPR